MIIAISGKMGSGKDYITENIIIPSLKGKRVSKIAFADQIKVNVATRNNIPLEKLVGGDRSAEHRRLLQIEGTEEGRMKYGEDIWVKTVENWIKLRKMRDNIDVFIITDCRFPNEVDWVKSQGGKVIRVNAPKRTARRMAEESKGDPAILSMISGHLSETALDDYPFDHVIDNDPGDEISDLEILDSQH